MAYPKFQLDANVLQFTRGIKFPNAKPHEKLQVIDRSAGGSIQVEDLGVDIHTRRLSFRSMPKTDYDALRVWFDTVADGAMNEFTYTDENGVAWTARILTPKLDFPETAPGKYSGDLLLEVR